MWLCISVALQLENHFPMSWLIYRLAAPQLHHRCQKKYLIILANWCKVRAKRLPIYQSPGANAAPQSYRAESVVVHMC